MKKNEKKLNRPQEAWTANLSTWAHVEQEANKQLWTLIL